MMTTLTATDIRKLLTSHLVASDILQARAQRDGAVSETFMADFAQSAGRVTASLLRDIDVISKADVATIRAGLTGLELAKLGDALGRACMGTPVPAPFYAALIMVGDSSLSPAEALGKAQTANDFLELGNPQRLIYQTCQKGVILIPPTQAMVKAIFDKVISRQAATGEVLRDVEGQHAGRLLTNEAIDFCDAVVGRDRRAVMETLEPLIYTPIPLIQSVIAEYEIVDIYDMLMNIAGAQELTDHYHLYAALLMMANPAMSEDDAAATIRQTSPLSLKNPHNILFDLLPAEDDAGDKTLDGPTPTP